MMCGAAALTAACSSAPPPEPEVPQTPVKEPEPPPPPPPPKCEALDEKCEATGTTKAKIAKSNFAFNPAKGWTYAQGTDATVAQTGTDGAAVVLAQAETGTDAKQETTKREAALEEIAKQISVTIPKKKVNWKKPADEKAVGDLKVALWQIDGSSRGEKKGPLLIFVAPLPEGKALLGLGFVPEDDSSKADEAILASIESIAPSEGSGKKESSGGEEASDKGSEQGSGKK